MKTKIFTSTTSLKAQTVLSTRQLIGRNLCCSSSGINHFLGLIHPCLIAASASRTCKEFCHGEIAGTRTLNPFLDTGFQDRLTTNYHTISYLRVFPPSTTNCQAAPMVRPPGVEPGLTLSRPLAYKTSALTDELRAHIMRRILAPHCKIIFILHYDFLFFL